MSTSAAPPPPSDNVVDSLLDNGSIDTFLATQSRVLRISGLPTSTCGSDVLSIFAHRKPSLPVPVSLWTLPRVATEGSRGGEQTNRRLPTQKTSFPSTSTLNVMPTIAATSATSPIGYTPSSVNTTDSTVIWAVFQSHEEACSVLCSSFSASPSLSSSLPLHPSSLSSRSSSSLTYSPLDTRLPRRLTSELALRLSAYLHITLHPALESDLYCFLGRPTADAADTVGEDSNQHLVQLLPPNNNPKLMVQDSPPSSPMPVRNNDVANSIPLTTKDGQGAQQGFTTATTIIGEDEGGNLNRQAQLLLSSLSTPSSSRSPAPAPSTNLSSSSSSLETEEVQLPSPLAPRRDLPPKQRTQHQVQHPHQRPIPTSSNYFPLSSNPPNPSKAEFRLGDWICSFQTCSAHNFGRNVSCIGCGRPRASVLAPSHPSSSSTGPTATAAMHKSNAMLSPMSLYQSSVSLSPTSPIRAVAPSPRFATVNGLAAGPHPQHSPSMFTRASPESSVSTSLSPLRFEAPSLSSHHHFHGSSSPTRVSAMHAPLSPQGLTGSSYHHHHQQQEYQQHTSPNLPVPKPTQVSHNQVSSRQAVQSHQAPSSSPNYPSSTKPKHPLLTPSGHNFAIGGRVQNISRDPFSPCIMFWPDNEPFPEQGQIRPGYLASVHQPPILNTGNRGPISHQPGDWICLKCNYLNWRRRKVCQTCLPYAEGNGDSISAAVHAERIARLTNVLAQTRLTDDGFAPIPEEDHREQFSPGTEAMTSAPSSSSFSPGHLAPLPLTTSSSSSSKPKGSLTSSVSINVYPTTPLTSSSSSPPAPSSLTSRVIPPSLATAGNQSFGVDGNENNGRRPSHADLLRGGGAPRGYSSASSGWTQHQSHLMSPPDLQSRLDSRGDRSSQPQAPRQPLSSMSYLQQHPRDTAISWNRRRVLEDDNGGFIRQHDEYQGRRGEPFCLYDTAVAARERAAITKAKTNGAAVGSGGVVLHSPTPAPLLPSFLKDMVQASALSPVSAVTTPTTATSASSGVEDEGVGLLPVADSKDDSGRALYESSVSYHQFYRAGNHHAHHLMASRDENRATLAPPASPPGHCCSSLSYSPSSSSSSSSRSSLSATPSLSSSSSPTAVSHHAHNPEGDVNTVQLRNIWKLDGVEANTLREGV